MILPVMQALQALIQTSPLLTPNNVALTLNPEPFPLASGPAVFISPLAHHYNRPTCVGVGRYGYMMEGHIRARVVDQSLRDVIYQDQLRLTNTITGLYRTAASVIDLTNIQFLLDANSQPLAIEPAIVSHQTKPQTYENAVNWSYTDLIYYIRYVDRTFNILADNTTQPAIPSNLADILLAIQNLLIATNIFNPEQVWISLSNDPFPMTDPPFAAITPGEFTFDRGTTYGAGRDFQIATGSVIIHVYQANEMDITGRADQMLGNFFPAYGLLTRAAAVVDRLQLAWPVTAGAPCTIEPLFVTQVGEPKYYKKAGNLASIPIVFQVQYQQMLS